MTNTFEHHYSDIRQILASFPEDTFTHVLAKVLPKNANDKNQIYWSADFNMLGSLFGFRFGDRGPVTSNKKGGANKGRSIPEAVFEQFSWITEDGRAVPAPRVKMLIYAQYPEMRLSGFKTETNEIPASLSVSFTKENPEAKRIMILGRTYTGGAAAMIVIPQGDLEKQILATPGFMGSRVVRLLHEQHRNINDLRDRLKQAAGQWMPGVRRTRDDTTIPFNGTQVCGYTLEDALEIIPNADKNGDYMGIELKAHTAKKLTLMTTEPDMGLYAKNFADFMTTYGYEKSGAWRWTGIHKEGMRSERSGLTLRIMGYNRNQPISGQLIAGELYIGLFDSEENLAAGWSMERILGGWDAKHNETVYVKATRKNTENPELLNSGHKYEVRFDNEVLWCRGTNPERLLNAILDHVIIIDPAPKYDPANPGNNKRRTQWRVNDIHKAVPSLYENYEHTDLFS
ncbi:hypothetical protein CS022_18290 [Veronia nyctiphanis]|uniref:MvaI/BcnI restriction endonuclease domain-containing protein n=1 Tax=Veronia nyctiphanis TaxID=1278244 RepID=A0A4Q0YMS8_9GAMM|nr:MvaI/BcnI family restriction endonuclease [Veronia nyctiphanis]RXJ72029.1 hypothetical protein CS022_18010 [Veronia nyctiphanis]RXJ72076.1 hypothetical protein CS022_18290 [Veronia nyctiphanis]